MNLHKPVLGEPEVAARIQEFEKRHQPFLIEENGVSLWQLLRFDTSVQLQNLELRRVPIPRMQLLLSLPRAARQFMTAKRDLVYVAKTSNSGLRDWRDGEYRDIYFDDLLDAVPGGGLLSSIDATGFSKNVRKAHRRPVFDDTAVVVASALLGRVPKRGGPSPAAKRLSELIIHDFGLVDFTAGRIQRKYDVFRIRAAIYRRVLRRLGVRVVAAANNALFPLIAASRSLGVVYIEVQHGDYGANHPDSIPGSALKANPASLLLPDCLAVFGDRDVERLSGTAIGQLGRIRPVGAPTIARARILREASFRADPQCPVITFTSQGFAREEVDAFINEFLGRYTGQVKFLIRMHPGYDGDGANYRATAARDRRVEVMAGDARPPTNEVIALSDLHLSISSTCHYDALGIGTPTGVLALPGHATMAGLVDSNLAPLIASAEQLADMVTRRGWRPVAPATSNYVFRPGYISNMQELLREWGAVAR